MFKNRFNLRTVANTLAILAVTAIFSSCNSSEKRITAFDFDKPTVECKIDEEEKTVSVVVHAGRDVKALVPTIKLSSRNAASVPASGTPQDFTKPVTYTIVAKDKSTVEYTVTVTTTPISGTWIVANSDYAITFDGDAAVFSQINSGNWLMLLDRGRVKIGDRKFRNVVQTSSSTWKYQELWGEVNRSGIPTGATGWSRTETFNMTENGDTLFRVGNERFIYTKIDE